MAIGIGIDTGGTYTDAVVYDFDKKEVIAKGKTLTTKENLEIGIGNALDMLPFDFIKQATVLSLSTTLATNACVENKGGRAKVVLVGTSKEVLESIDAETVYGLKPEDVLCLDTYSSFDGKIVGNPDWDQVMEEHDGWFSDAQALAVAAMNAMRNGAVCEKSAKEKLTAKYKVPFVMAYELASEYNVMERGATAFLNAKLLPTIEEFMKAVKAALKTRDIDIKAMIVRSDGSLMSDEMALLHPVKTILSGPAASIIGGKGLTDCKDCLIVDMGGTTTDISIVQNGKPAMAEGIAIGGYKTQVKGVFIDTFGLGGDSRITVEDNELSLHARRVMPLCVASKKYPVIKEQLQSLLDSKKSSRMPVYEFLYLVKEPSLSTFYKDYEMDLIDKLRNGPLMLGGDELDVYNLRCERLEDEGIIMRCGLTPTDMMHIKGDFDLFDKSASVLAVSYLLKVFPQYENIMQFCDAVYDLVCRKLYENIVRILLIHKWPKRYKKGIDGQLLSLIQDSYDDSQGYFSYHFHTDATLVGVGAPTHIFLPKVAEKLGTGFMIPPHSEVANAVGTIIANIDVEVKVNIAPIHTVAGITGYTVYTENESATYDTLEESIEFAESSAKELAMAKARKRGALGEMNVQIERNPKTGVTKDGDAIDLGTTIVARASGRL